MNDLSHGMHGRETISQMASAYQVSLRTLRFYEERGLLTPFRMGLSRYYSPQDEIRLQLVLKGKKLGFSLLEIERMIRDARPETPDTCELHLSKDIIAGQIKMLERKRSTMVAAIDELKLALTG